MAIRLLRWGFATLVCFSIASVATAMTSIDTSIEKALKYNPRLKVLQNNRDALKHELRQAFGGYLPRVDLAAGYGSEQHSDAATRAGNDPADDDREPRGEASLTLDQLIYDGGLVSGRVAAQKAKLESAEQRVFDNAEAISLDAVIAHLDVYRQRKLVELAEDNIKVHREILRAMETRQRAGAGSIADVTQTLGRLARAKASLASEKAGLGAVVANYERVVGEKPGPVAFTDAPGSAPETQMEAVALVRQGNPKVLARDADIDEAEARYKQAKSPDLPKLNLELSSNYEDQVEGDSSWQNTNAAMLRMRWNLFKGGSDAAGKRSARFRVRQAVANRNDQLVDVVEEAQATWAQYLAAKEQSAAYKDAVKYTKQTLNSYLKQFNVAQRTLLDVLDAENELFQSSGLWVTAQVNETIGACRLLALAGRLQEARGKFVAAPELDISFESLILTPQEMALSTMPLPALETPPGQRDKVTGASRAAAGVAPAARSMLARPEPVLEDPQMFLERWAAAWAAQDVETYLASYSDNFIPAKGLSRKNWEQQRRVRFKNQGFVQVELTDLVVRALSKTRVSVQAVQLYRSERLTSRTIKEFELEQKAGRWSILREKVLSESESR